MKIQVSKGDISQFTAEAVVVNLFEGVTQPDGGTGRVNEALGGLIADELTETVRFKGSVGETLVLHTHKKLPARYVVLVGLGKADKLEAKTLRRASAAAIRACMGLKVKSVATLLHGAGIGGFEVEAAARLLAEGSLLGAYKFTKYKQNGKPNGSKEDADTKQETVAIETLTVVEIEEARLPAITKGVQQGLCIAEQVNQARDWVFDSGNHVTPTYLKEQAEAIAGLQCTVLDDQAIDQLGMGAFSAVKQGTSQPAYLIHLRYTPASGTPKKKITLVGKGITFDSGGLSLKPPQGQELMKSDMAGAAAVLATMKAVAAMPTLEVQVDAFIPTCENMPGGRAVKPGDIVRALNGKTIEINNTDAEGRLILCDALTYAQQQVAPDEIIDLATLTGACVIALGKVAAGMMGNTTTLQDSIREAGEHAGEKFWPLPLYEEYKDALKSDVADLINAGAKGEAGASAAGVFLQAFIEGECPWVHLDIAGPAYTGKDVPEVPKGASGFGVRTLLYYLYSF